MKNVSLNWRELVRFVNQGKVEVLGRPTKPNFMFWQNPCKAAFISDPMLLTQIDRARNHSNPFLLIGPQHTGKNIFLNLIARGTSMPCVDENIASDPDVGLEHFFGVRGVVDRNRAALIHFDFSERALAWNVFMEKVYKIAYERILHRTDGKIIKCPKVRVVLGANFDLRPMLSGTPSLVKFLYGALAGYQDATTRRLEDQPERLPTILSEMIASLVLQRQASETQARKIQNIPQVVLARLQDYSVPDGFTGLFKVVREAAHAGSWEAAVANTQLGKVFVAWGGRSRQGGAWLADKLRDNGIIVEKAPESLGAGEWWPQIKSRLSKADFIVFTFTRADFEPGSRLVKLKEWREAVEIEKQLPRPLIFPVFLDRTTPEDLAKIKLLDQGLLQEILKRQLYWVSPRSGKGFTELFEELKRLFHAMRSTP